MTRFRTHIYSCLGIHTNVRTATHTAYIYIYNRYPLYLQTHVHTHRKTYETNTPFLFHRYMENTYTQINAHTRAHMLSLSRIHSFSFAHTTYIQTLSLTRTHRQTRTYTKQTPYLYLTDIRKHISSLTFSPR